MKTPRVLKIEERFAAVLIGAGYDYVGGLEFEGYGLLGLTRT